MMEPNKETRMLQRKEREKQLSEMIKGLNFFYDWLDSGTSIEELEIWLDITAAGAGWSKQYHEFWRQGLQVVKAAQEDGADRNEVITYLRESQGTL